MTVEQRIYNNEENFWALMRGLGYEIKIHENGSRSIVPAKKPEESQSGIKLMHEAVSVTRLEAAMDEVVRERPESIYEAKFFTRKVFEKLFPRPKMVTKEAERFGEEAEYCASLDCYIVKFKIPENAINEKCTYEVPE